MKINNMSKLNKILIAVVIVLLVVLIALFVWRWWFAKPVSDYYALYLKNGELYFGKLVHFPHFGLKQVYMLQVNNGNSQIPLSIQKFSKVFWGPEDYIRINRDEVVWMTRLSAESELVKVVTVNPDLIPQNNQAQDVLPFNNGINTAPNSSSK